MNLGLVANVQGKMHNLGQGENNFLCKNLVGYIWCVLYLICFTKVYTYRKQKVYDIFTLSTVLPK